MVTEIDIIHNLFDVKVNVTEIVFGFVPVNNFSIMLGRSHCFLGIYQYIGELKVSCSRTLHGGSGVRTLDLSLWSPTAQNGLKFFVEMHVIIILTFLTKIVELLACDGKCIAIV